MLLTRPVILVLALLVSPVGAAVCEVVCGTPGHAAAHAPVAVQTDAAAAAHAHHDHHAHHAQPPATPVPPVSDTTDGVMQVPGPDCEPVLVIPARIRSTFDGGRTFAVSGGVDAPSSVADSTMLTHTRVVIADTGPPNPPRHAPIPLRI